MKIVDTYSDIQSCFMDGVFNLNQWCKYAENILPNLSVKLQKDAKAYNFDKEIFPVIQNAFQNKEKLHIAHKTFLSTTKELIKSFTELFGEELDVTVIFYLGLCNGAGWATEINNQKVILLGIEKIVELDWCSQTAMKGLIYHELGHIFHYKLRLLKDELNNDKEKSLFQLYTEGFAMYIEQLLCKDMSFYHQNINGWLQWCEDNQKRLFKLYLTKIDNNENTQEFFGDWNNIEGKSDVGYYLGCEMIRNLSSQYALKELANLNLSVVEKYLRQRCENEI